jgi:hypothetical protein
VKDETVLIRLLEMISVRISIKDINSGKAEKLRREENNKGHED